MSKRGKTMIFIIEDSFDRKEGKINEEEIHQDEKYIVCESDVMCRCKK